ncbi:MAG: hypothetical protein AAGA48_25880 [Myxococcota bacterium]
MVTRHRLAQFGTSILVLSLMGCSGDSDPNTDATLPVPVPDEIPCIQLSPQLLDFGEIRFGATGGRETFEVRNNCEGELIVTAMSFEGGDTFTLEDVALPFSVFAGRSEIVSVRTQPQGYGAFSDQLIVQSNDPNFPSDSLTLVVDSVCTSTSFDIDTDGDGIPDGCDACAEGDDSADADLDSVPDACDACEGFDDALDKDLDTVPDACDVCPFGNDTFDGDGDTVPDACDICPFGSDLEDGDGDTVPDACDVCELGDDAVDDDADTVPNACDICAGADDRIDDDLDTRPNGCDVCPGFDDLDDLDSDGNPDGCDICQGFDDNIDTDGDGVPGDGLSPNSCDVCEGFLDSADADGDSFPDGCDRCPLGSDLFDTDGDFVPDACDICEGFDDQIDGDGDGRPDGCDSCLLGDDSLDADSDDVADACDICQGFDDRVDNDFDGFPDGCDLCPGFDDSVDLDGDTVPNGCDVCPGEDDRLDDDNDGVPDGCDRCPNANDNADADADTVPDACDLCPFADDLQDRDSDSIPDACDACDGFNDAIDLDGDGIPGDGTEGSCDICEGFADRDDADVDGIPDGCDACRGFDDLIDEDQDGVPNGCDICTGFDDLPDADGDLIPDGCDQCAAGDDLLDADADTIADACDACPGFDDRVDIDLDGAPDACDTCLGAPQTDNLAPASAPKLDLLFVIDDSCSMLDDQNTLANAFSGLTNGFGVVGADWQIGVITTSSATLQGPIIVPGPSASSDFTTQVTAGTNGLAVEAGIDRAWEATQPLGDAGPGSPFLRSDAALVILFFSDDQDSSMAITPQQALTYWQGLKGAPEQLAIHGFLNPFATAGYDVVIDQGRIFDIFDQASFVTNLEAAVLASTPPTTRTLSALPVVETLDVKLDGVSSSAWRYDSCANRIEVSGGALGTTTTITVDYVEDCGSSIGACSDGLDNDGDGRTDFPNEPGCSSACDNNETDPAVLPRCADGLDSDADGQTDFPADPECASAADRSESCSVIDIDDFGYQMCEELLPVGICPDLSASLVDLGLGDEGTASVPLGFDFDFYGDTYTSVWVGANGTLSFGNALSPASNQCLPDDRFDAAIMAWWDDLNPAGGSVWTRTSGAGTTRRFEVQWKVPHVNGTSTLDVRAVLHEATGDIDLCYVDSIGGLGIDNGTSATSGIQRDFRGFHEFSCGSPDLTTGNVVRFLHP